MHCGAGSTKPRSNISKVSPGRKLPDVSKRFCSGIACRCIGRSRLISDSQRRGLLKGPDRGLRHRLIAYRLIELASVSNGMTTTDRNGDATETNSKQDS